MFIQTEDTPNPETIKFIPGQPVMPKGIIEFDAVEKAMKSPLAKQIFAVKRIISFSSLFFEIIFNNVLPIDPVDPKIAIFRFINLRSPLF